MVQSFANNLPFYSFLYIHTPAQFHTTISAVIHASKELAQWNFYLYSYNLSALNTNNSYISMLNLKPLMPASLEKDLLL